MVRSLACLFIAVLLFLCLRPAFGQDVPMLHYTVDNGLPSNTVYSIYRDSRGYLWIATDKGIAKYNGIKFEVFTTFNGLPDNEIFFFKEDYEGRLWLGTYNGELCYYKDGIIHTATNTPFLKMPFKTPFLRQIILEKDSSLTFVFKDNFKMVNIHHERLKPLDLEPLNDKSLRQSLLYSNKSSPNRYEFIYWKKIIVIDSFCHLLESQDQLNGKNLSFINFSVCQNQEYIYDDTGFYTTQFKRVRNFQRDFLKNNFLHQIYVNGKDCFLTTNHGIYLNDSIRILKDVGVSCITQDNLGNYWMSTLGSGIFSMNQVFKSARLYKDVYKGEVQFVYNHNDLVIYTTTDNSINMFSNGKSRKLYDYTGFSSNGKFPQQAFYIDSNYRYYYCYGDGNVVIDNLLAARLNIKKYRANFSMYGAAKSIIAICDSLYFNIRDKVLFTDYSRYKQGDLLRYQQVSDSTRSERIFCMAQAPDKSIWYSSNNSVYKIVNNYGALQPKFKNITFKTFAFFGRDLVGYTHKNQLLICNDYGGKMSVDSVINENCIWDKFFALDANHILVSTNNLYRLITLYPANTSKKFQVSVIENPFIPLQPEAICSDGANCYFFKDGSIISADIRGLIINADPPELYFTSVKAGKDIYSVSNSVEIPYNESKNITVSFSPISFSGKDIEYEYSVSKSDSDNWRIIKSDEINLYNSGYGTYFIKVKAKTSSSAYSTPIVFTLNILPPFWTTWWFIALCFCAGFVVVGLFNRRRILKAVRKKEKEHESEIRFMRSEYKAMNALMNPHFIFNTLNNVQGLVNRNDKLAANEYLRVFADLIRQNMHNISKELIPLQKEVDLVNNYLLLEKLRFKELLNYEINIERGLDLSDIMVSPLLLQPLVENSIKHGILPLESAEGFIYINIYKRSGLLYIEVKDNGVGMNKTRDKSQTEHESFGLENIRKRIHQLSVIQNKKISFNISEIKDDKGKVQWTVVTLVMPFSD